MAATYTQRGAPAELEQREPGFGGRPPVRNRPTGGGGDGDSGDDGLGRRGPRATLQRVRLGLSFLLAADLIFFLSLISEFFLRSSSGYFDATDHYVADWQPLAVPLSLWFATGLLLVSSVTMEFGRRRLFEEMDVLEEWLGMGRPMARRTLPWLAATAALGAAYLACVAWAWHSVAASGVRFGSSPDSAFFFILTGSHVAHAILGIALLAGAALGLYRLRRVEQRQVLVDAVAWCWHAMTVYGMLVFSILALARS